MPTVEFERSVETPASPTQVWEAVTDVHRLVGWVQVLGGLEEIQRLKTYTAVLADRLGPFKLSADLLVDVSQLEEGRHVTFIADGEDRQVASRIKINGSMDLLPSGTGTTVRVYGGYEVTGKVATLGASMIRAKGEKIIDEFAAALADLGNE